MDIKGTILVVDDQPNDLWFVSKIFQALGYSTLTAQTAVEAIRFIEDCGDRIDLLLFDVEMPGIEGTAILGTLLRKKPGLSTIVVTRLDESEAECRKLGIHEFIKKPYSLQELHTKIEAALGAAGFSEPVEELEQGVIPSAKILIVDDEMEVGQSIAETLMEDFSDLDFKIRWAGNGEEALKISKEFKPDIAIIDIKMPGMSGDELIQKFKDGEGNCPRDFVIYTGAAEVEILERVQSLGHKVIAKPMNIEALYQVLKKICIRHHLLKKV